MTMSRELPRRLPTAGFGGNNPSFAYAFLSIVNGLSANRGAKMFGGGSFDPRSAGSGCTGNTSTPPSVYEVDLFVVTLRLAPSGTPKVLLMTGMPGVPGAPGESVFDMASLVQVLPPPVSETK